MVRQLGPDHMWHTDVYYYFMAPRSILQTGGLDASPQMVTAYGGVSSRLQRFILPTLTAEFSQVTGLGVEQLRLYGTVVFGIGVFFIAWAIFRMFVHDVWGVVGAYLYSMMNVVIFHHVRYHHIAVATFVAILSFYLIFKIDGDVREYNHRWYGLLTLFLIISVFTHVFIPNYLAGLLVLAIPVSLILNSLGIPTILAKKKWYLFQAIMPFLIATGYFVTETSAPFVIRLARISGFLNSGIRGQQIYRTAAESTLLDHVPIITKLLLGLFTLPAIYSTIRNRESNLWMPGLLAGLTSIIVVIGFVVNPGASGRLFPILFLLMFVFVLRTFSNIDFEKSQLAPKIITVVVVVLLVGNAMLALSPSRIDPSADISNDGYNEIEPIGEQFPTAGLWLRSFGPSDQNYYALLRVKPIGFYYGLKPTTRLSRADTNGYAINDRVRFPELLQGANRIYDNGRIEVSYGPTRHINPRFSSDE
jgi:hypothetical protein